MPLFVVCIIDDEPRVPASRAGYQVILATYDAVRRAFGLHL